MQSSLNIRSKSHM